MSNILKMIEKQSEIIRIQSEIIDTLSIELLQEGLMTESDLKKIKTASSMQVSLETTGGD